MLLLGQFTTTPIGPQDLPSGPVICPAKAFFSTSLKSVRVTELEACIGTYAQTVAWTSHIGL